MVQIKKIGEQIIEVTENKGHEGYFNVLCGLNIVLGVITGICYGLFATESILLYLGISFGICMLISIIHTLTEESEWYRVGIQGSGLETEIPKINSPEDQIAVCKASKELESKAQELEDRRLALEKIAANCK